MVQQHRREPVYGPPAHRDLRQRLFDQGALRTLSIRADIEIVPNRSKNGERANPRLPRDHQWRRDRGAWQRTGRDPAASVSLSWAAPEFDVQALRQSRACGRTGDDNVFAVIWNPAN